MAGHVLLDVTSIAVAPVRSGIQRVEREVIRHWPGPQKLVFAAFDSEGTLRLLPESIRGILLRNADEGAEPYERDRRDLHALCAGAPVLPDSVAGHIVNLELFFERTRADAYLDLCRRAWRVQWLVYDFMPWLHPELFANGSSVAGMHYIRALRGVPETAFISDQTRTEYETRVMRGTGRAGPVLPLGADGLGLERQSWSLARRDIVMLGTVERRKNICLVMEAFRRLWAEGVDLRLVLAGRIASDDQPAIDAFAIEAGRRAEILDHATDAQLRDVLRRARAVLFASAVEGFGLPPYEAIHAGIPAIAATTLPSMQALPPDACVGLPQVTLDALMSALRALNDDTEAERRWSQTAVAHLPSWSDFVAHFAQWVAAG